MRVFQRLLVLTAAVLAAASASFALETAEAKSHSEAPLGPRSGVVVENLLGSIRLVAATKPGAVKVEARAVSEAKTREEAQALAKAIKIERTTEGKDVRFHVVFPVEEHASFRPPKAGVKGLIGRWTSSMLGEPTSVDYDGRTVQVGAERKATGLAVHLTVTVPYDRTVSVRQHVGSVEGRALRGDVRVATLDADVAFERCLGSLDLDARNGQLTVASFQGKALTVNLGTGEAELREVRADKVHLKNDSGSIKGDDMIAGELVIDNASGVVQVAAEFKAVRATAGTGLVDLASLMTTARTAEIRSEAGDVVLRVGDLSHFDLAAESKTGQAKLLGGVSLELVAQEGLLQRFQHGQGGPDVKIEAPQGQVTVRPYDGSRFDLLVNGRPRPQK